MLCELRVMKTFFRIAWVFFGPRKHFSVGAMGRAKVLDHEELLSSSLIIVQWFEVLDRSVSQSISQSVRDL